MNHTRTFEPSAGQDFTPLVRVALSDPLCCHLSFGPGRYDFHPDLAGEAYLFVSNNDEGLKPMAFPLFGRENLVIEGEGAAFVFHGGIVPFVLQGCRGIVLRGFSVDWEIPFHGEGEVLQVDAGGVEIRIPDTFVHRVADGRLEFGESPEPFEIRNILEFDAGRRETAFLVRDNYGIGRRCVARETGPRTVRLDAPLSKPWPRPGNILALMGDRRDYPAIVVIGSSDVTVEDVTIQHAGGMGFIAQRSEDITLRRVRVTPPADGSRMISTTADATHFVHCRGAIRLLDCLFENQMDDATNIHGIYARVCATDSADVVDARLCHSQQFGVEFAAAGDRVEFVNGETLVTWQEAVVTSVERLNKRHFRLHLDRPLSRPPLASDVVGNLSWVADVELRGCVCRNNRARGFLVSTSGKTVIAGNHFHTPGAAILIASDAHDWFESGYVRDVLIRDNHFENCNFGVWGQAALQILPRLAEPRNDAPKYHQNVRIEENTFTVFDPRIVLARNVEGLVISGNRIEGSKAYPPQNANASPFDTGTCSEVLIEQDVFPIFCEDFAGAGT